MTGLRVRQPQRINQPGRPDEIATVPRKTKQTRSSVTNRKPRPPLARSSGQARAREASSCRTPPPPSPPPPSLPPLPSPITTTNNNYQPPPPPHGCHILQPRASNGGHQRAGSCSAGTAISSSRPQGTTRSLLASALSTAGARRSGAFEGTSTTSSARTWRRTCSSLWAVERTRCSAPGLNARPPSLSNACGSSPAARAPIACCLRNSQRRRARKGAGGVEKQPQCVTSQGRARPSLGIFAVAFFEFYQSGSSLVHKHSLMVNTLCHFYGGFTFVKFRLIGHLSGVKKL